MDFHDYEVDLYEKLVKEYLWPSIGRVPLFSSPASLGDHPNIQDLPRQLERTGITILAPQDYAGRSQDNSKSLDYVRANAVGLEKASKLLQGTGVKLWSNCELFRKIPSPDGRGYNAACDFERMRQQIEMQAPLAEKLMCCSYQGIMNRRTDLVNIGHPSTDRLYSEYRQYLRKNFPSRFID
jgi:hypothetical protein